MSEHHPWWWSPATARRRASLDRAADRKRGEHVERLRPPRNTARQAYRYPLTREEYRSLLVGQAGRCLLCHRVPRFDLQADHDHATGMVRGLLCIACNTGIGHLRDNPTVLARGAAYLRRFGA